MNVFTLNGQAYEIYSTTQDMLHAVKLGQKGQRLSPKNFSNLLNLTPAKFETLKKIGVIKAA